MSEAEGGAGVSAANPVSGRAGGQLEPVPRAAPVKACVGGAGLSAGVGLAIAPLTDGGDSSASASAGQLVRFGTTVAVLGGDAAIIGGVSSLGRVSDVLKLTACASPSERPAALSGDSAMEVSTRSSGRRKDGQASEP